MSNLAVYITGILLVTAALVYAGYLVGIPMVWLVIGALVILGIGLMSAISNARKKEYPDQ